MKKLIWVLCALFALCATGHTVFAEDGSSGEYIEEDISYIESNFNPEPESDSVPDLVPDPDQDSVSPSLSEEHISILERLGDLLDYSSEADEDFESVSMDDIEDQVIDDSYADSIDLLSSIDSSLSSISDVALYSDFTAFNGAISSTYLDLFRGFLPKLKYNQHYVLYRESQYVYSFVFGDDLSLVGTHFSGSDLTRVYFDAHNSGTFGSSYESSFTLGVGSAVVYTDLGKVYPSLSTDVGSQLIQIKWIIFISVLSFWMISLYKGYRRRGDRDKMWASLNTK